METGTRYESGPLAAHARDAWTPELAELRARADGISHLTAEHWRVILFCREDHLRSGQTPNIFRLMSKLGLKLADLYRLFPNAPGLAVAHIAGVPEPETCL